MNPQGYPQQQGYGAPQPPRKKMSGCLLAALIVGGIGLVLCLVVGIFVWKAAKAITEVAQQGLNAPGAAELRAAGCDAAVVMDLSKVSSIFDAGGSSGTAGVVISCSVNPGHHAPSCDDLAKTYVKAVGGTASNSFVVEVQPQGGSRPECKKVYGPTGTYLHDQP